jgi:hypothetical protein
LVELTGGSLFNVAGLNLDDGVTGALPGARFYQNLHPGCSDIAAPMQIGPQPLPPAAVADTYVRGPATDVPVTAFGPIGNFNLQVSSGFNAIGERFNVSWGSTPNSGGNGIFEIAHMTIVNAQPGFTPITLQFGRVRDSINPNVDVSIPPIPVTIPEPASYLVLCTIALHRRRR